MRRWPLSLTGGWTFWTPRYCSDHVAAVTMHRHPCRIRGKRSACLQMSVLLVAVDC